MIWHVGNKWCKFWVLYHIFTKFNLLIFSLMKPFFLDSYNMLLTPLLESFPSRPLSTLYIRMCQLSSYEVDLARWEKINN